MLVNYRYDNIGKKCLLLALKMYLQRTPQVAELKKCQLNFVANDAGQNIYLISRHDDESRWSEIKTSAKTLA